MRDGRVACATAAAQKSCAVLLSGAVCRDGGLGCGPCVAWHSRETTGPVDEIQTRSDSLGLCALWIRNSTRGPAC